MTQQTEQNALINEFLPDFFEKLNLESEMNRFGKLPLWEKERMVEDSLRLHYLGENQIELRNSFRKSWNLIIEQNEK